MTLSPTARSTINRGKRRAVADREALHAVLDAGMICHLGFVSDGAPVVLPTGYARDGDRLLVHGSSGAHSLRTAGAGAEICVTVTLLDGIVYARAVFHNSANYRSAVVHGTPEPITEPEEKLRALWLLTERLAPGSWEHARGPTKRELAQTSVVALDLTEAAVKIRSGPPGDDEDDVRSADTWAGVLPVHRRWGEPEPCPLLPAGTPVPDYVRHRAGWSSPAGHPGLGQAVGPGAQSSQ